MSIPRARIVAGVDTRTANATPTVRAAAHAATAIAGPVLLVLLAGPEAWRAALGLSGPWHPWLTVAALICSVAAAHRGWRARPPSHPARALPGGGDAAVVLVLLAIAAGGPNEDLRAAALAGAPLAGGWAIGRAARLAADAVPERIRSAAAGVVTARALAGALIAGHLALVLDGSGPRRAAAWAVAYLCASVLFFRRAGRTAPSDRARANERTADISPIGENAALVAHDVRVAFGDRLVLRSATLRASSGQLVALVGANGAGKSTLLRVIAGLQDARAGSVRLAGEEITELLPEERAAAGVAFVSGARPVFPDLTVMQNLRVAAFRTHLTRRSFTAATDAIFSVLPRLAERRDVRAGVLSGGEQRLLAMAQTMYRVPKVLLADELALGLDADARVAVLDLLRAFADMGVAVVVVDHDLLTLLPRADRAVLLHDGATTEHAPAVEVLRARSDLLDTTFLAGAVR